MNRFRVKLAGLIVVAGSAIGADTDVPFRASSGAAPPELPPLEPALLPQPARGEPWTGSAGAMNPIWFNANKPTPPRTNAPAAAPGTVSAPTPIIVQPVVDNRGPTPNLHYQTSTSGDDGRSLIVVSGQFADLRFAQALLARKVMPWLESLTTPGAWPPLGPRIGYLPPGPLPSVHDLPPIVSPPPEHASNDPPPAVGAPAAPSVAVPMVPAPEPWRKQDGGPSIPPIPIAPQTPQQTQTVPLPAVQPQPGPGTQQAVPGLTAPQSQSPRTVLQPVLPETQIPRGPLQPPEESKELPVAPAPKPTNLTPPAVLPQPRPMERVIPTGPAVVPGQPQVAPLAPGEMPTAPPELMVPAGVMVAPGKSGTFGSAPVRLSKDYPSLSDLCGTPLHDRIGSALGQDGLDRGFVQGEFLLWWMQGFNIPVLATTSTSPTGTGYLGDPATVPIIGPGNVVGGIRPGVRLRAGYWLDEANTWAIDGSIFYLGQSNWDSAVGSNQYPVITRPIFSPNPFPGSTTLIGETGEAVAVPGILAGGLTVHAQSVLWGADVNLRRCLLNDCDTRASWFVGYRNLNLIESLKMTENITVIGPGDGRVLLTDPIGSIVRVQDRFGTTNHFNGGQIGGTYERRWGRFDFDARGSVALGVTSQELSISGSQTRTPPGGVPVNFQGGLLAVGPNLGNFTGNQFSVVPEVTLNAGYWVLPNLKVHMGFNFIYWTNVIRPGGQIDNVVDLTYVPNAPHVPSSGQARPQPLFHQSDLWVTGLQFGAEWRW
jgi:hypothetical protein